MFLTALARQTRLRVVVEEGIQAGAEDQNVGGVEHAQPPRFLAAGPAAAVREGRVFELRVRDEGRECRGVRLHVGGLGLDGAQVDGLGVGDLVVVQLGVLGGGAVEPDGAGGAFDEDAAAVVDVDLVVVGQVEFVVRDPEPVVFQVDGRLWGDVQQEEGAFARGVGGRDGGWVFGAGVGL